MYQIHHLHGLTNKQPSFDFYPLCFGFTLLASMWHVLLFVFTAGIHVVIRVILGVSILRCAGLFIETIR